MARLRFLLDENMQVVIADQLVNRGIEALTVRDLGGLGWPDAQVLNTATNLGYVLCTHDSDYLVLAASGVFHAGIILGQAGQHRVGTGCGGCDYGTPPGRPKTSSTALSICSTQANRAQKS